MFRLRRPKRPVVHSRHGWPNRSWHIPALMGAVCLLLAAEHGVFSETPVAEVLHRRTALLSVLAAEEGSTLRAIDSSGTLTQAQQDSLVACMERFKARKDGEGDAADA